MRGFFVKCTMHECILGIPALHAQALAFVVVSVLP